MPPGGSVHDTPATLRIRPAALRLCNVTRQTITVITDDLDGTDEAENVSFGFEGQQYEIDLSEENRARLADALQPFIAKARRAGAASRSVRRGRTPDSDRRSELSEIRAWARSNGHTVSERGRIPATVMDAYAAQH